MAAECDGRRSSEDAAITNGAAARSLAVSAAASLYLRHNSQALYHLSENDVLTIEMRGWNGRDEELQGRQREKAFAEKIGGARACLAAVGVGARVGHGEQAGCVVLVLEVLVRKFCAVDALTAGAVVVGEVAALQHETWNYAVEAGALVTAEVIMRSARKKERAKRTQSPSRPCTALQNLLA